MEDEIMDLICDLKCPSCGKVNIDCSMSCNQNDVYKGKDDCIYCHKEFEFTATVESINRTHEIIKEDDKTGIKCLICKKISYNKKDILHKYCGNCNIFHEVFGNE